MKNVCKKCLNPFDQMSSKNRCICLEQQKELDFVIKVSCFSEERLIVRAYRNSAYKILKLNEKDIDVKIRRS